MSDALDFTGERFIPGAAGEIWYEHWHRYHFAAQLVAGANVLDVACGAGYGSALLARRAAHVTGADLSAQAVDHARARYAAVANLEFRVADCAALPFADATFDAVVSFETIEHIPAQEAFLDEARRVLRPGGLLILSCPNKVEYSDKRNYVNEFHVRELYRDELAALLAPRFPHAAWFGQRPSFYSVIWPEQAAVGAEIFEVAESSAADSAPGHARPLYFIVVASRSADAVAAVAPRLSVLADRDEWIYRDYEKVTRNLDGATRRGDTLEGQVTAWQQHHDEAVRQRDRLLIEVEAGRAAITAVEAEVATRVAAEAAAARELAGVRATLAASAAELAQSRDALAVLTAERSRQDTEQERLRHEIARRAGLRWWLLLPWRRLRLAVRGKPPWT